MENNKNINTVLAGLFTLSATLLIVISGMYLQVRIGQDVNDIMFGYQLQKHVDDNNLSLPYPFFETRFDGFTEKYKHEKIENILSQNITEFTEMVNNNYKYTQDEYDCKYWSYVWSVYIVHNQYDNDWSIDYITTDNHIYVMAYNSTGYCTFDETEVSCRGISGNFNN